MDRLPAETLAEILWHLNALHEKEDDDFAYRWRPASPWSIRSRPILAPYAAISRTWQEVVERETFRNIGVDSGELPKLAVMFNGAAGDHRLRSLRGLGFLHLRDSVPFLTPARHGEVEELQRLADELFSRDVRALFGLLKEWEGRLDGSGGGHCSLELYLGTRERESDVAPTHPYPPIHEFPTVNAVMEPGPRDGPVVVCSLSDFVMGPLPGDAPEGPVVARRPRISMQYIGEEKLPELSLVSSVRLNGEHNIHLKSLMQILSPMKCLVDFGGAIFSEVESQDLACEYRKVLGQSLHLLPQSLKIFRPEIYPLDLEYSTLYSVLVDPLRDHLCISIRVLSGQLRELELNELRISSAIFAGDSDGCYPDWSSLEKVYISYPAISSTGQWFADTMSGADRSIPNPKLLNELYTAAGRAKQHMPSIKTLQLWLEMEHGGHSLQYYFASWRNSNILVLDSTVPFGFSDEVAEAWGFGLDAVVTREQGEDTIKEVLL